MALCPQLCADVPCGLPLDTHHPFAWRLRDAPACWAASGLSATGRTTVGHSASVPHRSDLLLAPKRSRSDAAIPIRRGEAAMFCEAKRGCGQEEAACEVRYDPPFRASAAGLGPYSPVDKRGTVSSKRVASGPRFISEFWFSTPPVPTESLTLRGGNTHNCPQDVISGCGRGPSLQTLARWPREYQRRRWRLWL